MEQSFIPKLAFDSLEKIQESFHKTASFSENDFEVLYSFFGEQLVLATELVDSSKIIEYTLENRLRNVFKILNENEQHTVFNDINLCNCKVFREQVLELRNAITCQHVLAVKLAKITGRILQEKVTGSQLVDFLNEQLYFVDSEDFNVF